MGRVHALALLCAVLAGCIGTSSALPNCTHQAAGAYVSLPNATVWNQDIMAAFGSGFRPSMGAVRGQEGHWLSALLTGFVLTGITVYALVTAPSRPISYHYFCIAMYTLFTGIVEFARFNFDASRFGFLTASWHNLWEYQIIAFLLLSPADAKKWTPRILLFVWVLDLWIMFAGSLDGVMSGVYWASLPEQLTGICADWVLVVTFLYLLLASSDKRPSFIRTDENPLLHDMFKWGAAAAAMHMAEIIPLVLLLAGLTSRPYLPISIIVSLTSPITFVLYTIFGKAWSGDNKQLTDKRKGVDKRDRTAILAISILIGLSTILGPIIAIPDCTSKQPTATGKPEISALVKPLLKFSKVPITNYATKEETAAAVAACLGRPPAWPETHGNGGAEKLTCPSKSVLRGVTVVTAKPGYGDALRKLVAPMAYPVRKQDGSLVWDLAYDGRKEQVVVTETWSNIRTLLKHVYTSPTVRSVFYGKEFAHTVQKQTLEGPFAAMLPCSEVAAEPDKLDFAFEATLDVHVDCAWNNMKNWTKDFTYVRGAKSLTPVPYSPDLHVLQMAQGFNITALRQPATSTFLPPVEQPAAGYRFVYYVLDGGFVPNIVADYVATVTIEEDDIPSKTFFTYHITATPAAGVSADTAVEQIRASFGPEWVQYMQNWASSLNCNRRNGFNGHRQVATAPAPHNETKQEQDNRLRALPAGTDSTALAGIAAGYAHTEF